MGTSCFRQLQDGYGKETRKQHWWSSCHYWLNLVLAKRTFHLYLSLSLTSFCSHSMYHIWKQMIYLFLCDFFCPCSVAFHKLHCSSVLHLYCHYQCLSYTEYLELNSLIGYGYESRLAEVEPWTSSKCLSAVGIINMPLDHLWFWILALGSHSSALVSFTPHGSLWSLNHNTALSWCWSFLMESMNMKSISFASRLETLRFDLYSRVSYKIRMGLGGLPVVVAYSDSFISPHFPSPRWSFLCALNINKVVMTLYHSIWF